MIALVRKRYLHVSLPQSLIQVTLGGVLVAGVGVAIGQADAGPPPGRAKIVPQAVHDGPAADGNAPRRGRADSSRT